jgi:hypothetical protein
VFLCRRTNTFCLSRTHSSVNVQLNCHHALCSFRVFHPLHLTNCMCCSRGEYVRLRTITSKGKGHQTLTHATNIISQRQFFAPRCLIFCATTVSTTAFLPPTSSWRRQRERFAPEYNTQLFQSRLCCYRIQVCRIFPSRFAVYDIALRQHHGLKT